MQAECGMQAVHNKCRQAMKKQKQCVDHLSDNELTCMLKKGVIVDGNKRFSVDAKHHMCVELFARALSIAGASNCNNWTFKLEKLSCGECVEVAELREACWLELKGHFDAKMLTPNTEYEVLFDMELKPCAVGFCHPVKFGLTHPNGCKNESEKCLSQFKGKGRVEIPIGKFRSPSEFGCESNVEFKMHETSQEKKRGLIVRGVILRPAKCGC